MGCLLLLRVPAVRLAAERHCRREGRCGGGTRDGRRRADASLRTLGTKDGRIRCAVRQGRETRDGGRARTLRCAPRDGRRGTGADAALRA